MKDNPLRPVIILVVLLSGFFVSGRSLLLKWGMDPSVLIIGNLVLFAVTLISFFLSKRGMQSDNPQAFIRAMIGSFMIKLFLCVMASLLYILTARKGLNKPSLFICMGLYLVYSFLEVSVLSKMTKRRKNV